MEGVNEVHKYTSISTIYEWQKIINGSFIYTLLFFHLNILENVNEEQFPINELMQNKSWCIYNHAIISVNLSNHN